MTARAHRGLTAAALCTAGLLAAAAPFAATANHGHRRPDHRHHRPAYGDPGFKPGQVKPAIRFAKLSGDNEIAATGRRRHAGDPDGQGGATISISPGGKVCFAIVVQGLTTPTLAHIHQGRKWQNGPVVVPLTPPATGDPGASSGCVDVADPGLLFVLRKHPQDFYVNVHTADFPNGALRGQLRSV